MLAIMHSTDMLTQLEGAFNQAAKEYELRRAEAERQVVEWRWASRDLFSLRPLEHRRRGLAPGRYLKKEPLDNADRCHIGHDALGRVVIERAAPWGVKSDGSYRDETFVRYEKGSAESAQYTHHAGKGMPLSMFTRLILADGVPKSCGWYSSHQKGFENYTYRDGRLVEADQLWCNNLLREDNMRSAVDVCEYDADGELVLVTITYRKVGGHSGGTYTAYKKKLPAEKKPKKR
jgi:hypothetical protein